MIFIKKTIILFCLLLCSLILIAQEGEKKEGFKEIAWGTPLSKVKEKVTGKIQFTDDKKQLISSDENIEYYYGFFYKKPLENTTEPAEADEGLLYYVTVKFPLLRTKDVLKKIEETHGEANKKNIIENKGAIVWDKPKTLIIMWVYNLSGEPFCSRVIYLGKELSEEVNNYKNEIFNKTEIEVLKKLNL